MRQKKQRYSRPLLAHYTASKLCDKAFFETDPINRLCPLLAVQNRHRQKNSFVAQISLEHYEPHSTQP